MAVDVQKTLIEVLVEHGSMAPPDAVALVAQMQREGRYVADVWS
jgi:sulfite reductase alpha subunit-like flavoprotein